MAFDYSLNFNKLDFRKHPECYRTGKGEQGVLLVQPYKDEILPFWRFKDASAARVSADKIYEMFEAYLRDGDFVGADMARKFLQMGFTRARRYANYRGGKKYAGPVPDGKRGQSGSHGRLKHPRALVPDPEKTKAAKIFKGKWDAARTDPSYACLKEKFEELHGR